MRASSEKGGDTVCGRCVDPVATITMLLTMTGYIDPTIALSPKAVVESRSSGSAVELSPISCRSARFSSLSVPSVIATASGGVMCSITTPKLVVPPQGYPRDHHKGRRPEPCLGYHPGPESQD